MRNRSLFITLICLAVIHFSTSLFAYGLGAYFNGGIGESRMKRYYNYMPPAFSLDYYFKGMNYAYGGGLVFDTCTAGDSLLHYRLQLGFEEFRYPKTPDIIWAEYNYTPRLSHAHAFRLSLKNTLGIAFFRNNLFRAWAGISISAVYYPNNLSSGNINIFLPRLFVPGAVVGLNYHFTESLSFVAECGLTYEWAASRDDLDYMNSLGGYLSVGVLFRLNKKTVNKSIRMQDIPREEVRNQQRQIQGEELH